MSKFLLAVEAVMQRSFGDWFADWVDEHPPLDIQKRMKHFVDQELPNADFALVTIEPTTYDRETNEPSSIAERLQNATLERLIEERDIARAALQENSEIAEDFLVRNYQLRESNKAARNVALTSVEWLASDGDDAAYKRWVEAVQIFKSTFVNEADL